jgi:asparagine synthase (glutamine-hydrolysing)
MCGILAVLNRDSSPVDRGLLVRMRDAMHHRGPDDAGLHLDGPVGLAHRRLSIVDLSPAGHQPMANEDGTLWLVFNGEIYNYVELTQELKRRGHGFRSHTDSEVILHLYEEEGERCVERLNGMFAFVLWDARARTLFAARDRVGIKPFYYYDGDSRFLCASEMKAILEDPAVPRRPNLAALADYLYVGSALGGKTPFEAIRELPPAHHLTLSNGRLRVRRYWDVQYDYNESRPWEASVEELAVLLQDAVRIHCRSDAPLGCHLSGGLDSSTVTSLAARFRHPLPSFSIRFDDHPFYDESAYAKLVAEKAGATYHEAAPGADDLMQLLASLVWHMDAPMPGPGGFSYYTVSRLAARHVKVTLTGHGGDEIFAGYPAQFEAAFGTTRMFDFAGRPRADASFSRRLARAVRRRGVVGLLRRAVRGRRPRPRTLAEVWTATHCHYRPADHPALHPDFVATLDGYSPEERFLEPLVRAPTDRPLDRCLYHDLTSYLPGLLHQEDRVSMALSLESRVPLLDHRLIEFLATVPPEQKVRNMVPKALLRAAAARWLPADVRNRLDKVPFPVPLGEWFAGPLRRAIGEVLGSRACRERGIFNPARLRTVHLEQAEAWSLLNVEVWFRVFVDRDPDWTGALQAASAVALRNRPGKAPGDPPAGEAVELSRS